MNNCPATGRYAILRQFMADGVSCMFGNPGSSEESLLDALGHPDFAGFKYCLGLHEGTVVAMADAYARASGPIRMAGDPEPWRRPALVQLHSYAGLANGLGMIYAAKRGYTPMVIIAGEAGVRYEAMDGQMAADLVTIVKPFVKSDHNGPCAWRAVDSRSLLRLVRRAIKTAATAPMGPVFLCLPMDVLDEPVSEPIERAFPVSSRVLPDRGVILAAARLLAAASRPLILMGDGIAASGAHGELVDVAERLGATVWGGNDSEVNMPASHPLYAGSLGHMFGEVSQPILSQADVVLVCGTTLLPEVFPSLGPLFAPTARVIQFDLNSAEIGKTVPVAIGALGDPKPTLAALALELAHVMGTAQMEAAAARREARRRDETAARERMLAEDLARESKGGVRPSRFARELADRLPPDALIFDEALTSSPELMRYLSRDQPGCYFQTRAGMLGTGLPGGVGLKLAHPDRSVVAFCGDGGGISTIQALATAARHRVGVKFVVCNNRSYQVLKDNLRAHRRSAGQPEGGAFPPSFDLSTPDLRFHELAGAQGVKALRVHRPDEISAALDAALMDANEPFLIELLLDPTL